MESLLARVGSGRGTRRMDKLQGARNNEAPVLGRAPEIGASRDYKSRGTRPPRRAAPLSVKRPIDVFQARTSDARGTSSAARTIIQSQAKRANVITKDEMLLVEYSQTHKRIIADGPTIATVR